MSNASVLFGHDFGDRGSAGAKGSRRYASGGWLTAGRKLGRRINDKVRSRLSDLRSCATLLLLKRAFACSVARSRFLTKASRGPAPPLERPTDALRRKS